MVQSKPISASLLASRQLEKTLDGTESTLFDFEQHTIKDSRIERYRKMIKQSPILKSPIVLLRGLCSVGRKN
jgi:hypothetical protein